jgi:hypothetical protein
MKKAKQKKPLERHKKVLKKISENIGKKASVEQAVKDAGYSKSYARSGHIKDTRSWDTLLKEEMPDGFLMEKHKELLEKKELFYNPKTGIIKSGQPHSDVKQALDMAFKLKSKYAPEEYNLKFKGFSKEQLVSTILNKITKKK